MEENCLSRSVKIISGDKEGNWSKRCVRWKRFQRLNIICPICSCMLYFSYRIGYSDPESFEKEIII